MIYIRVKTRRIITSAFVLLLAIRLPALAKDSILAVLSSDIAPYQESFAGFESTLEQPIDTVHMATEAFRVKGEPRLVITFGGKAALQNYPERSVLVYCMAPGTYLRPGDRRGPSIPVSMMPRAGMILAKMKEIQPNLKRLAILWISPSNENDVAELHKAGDAFGIEVDEHKLRRSEDLPDRLRALQGKTDALWIPPDPLLVNDQNIVLIDQFSSSARIPFYSAIAGLTEKGAVASFSTNYAEIGRAAGAAAKLILGGSRLPTEIYPDKFDVAINPQAAEKAGLVIDKSLLDRTHKIQP